MAGFSRLSKIARKAILVAGFSHFINSSRDSTEVVKERQVDVVKEHRSRCATQLSRLRTAGEAKQARLQHQQSLDSHTMSKLQQHFWPDGGCCRKVGEKHRHVCERQEGYRQASERSGIYGKDVEKEEQSPASLTQQGRSHWASEQDLRAVGRRYATLRARPKRAK